MLPIRRLKLQKCHSLPASPFRTLGGRNSLSITLKTQEPKTMTTEAPRYLHTQKAPLCLLIYALAVMFIGLGWVLRNEPTMPWLFPPIGVLLLVIAASFHSLTVEEQDDRLTIHFGPIPLFRKAVSFVDIIKVEVGRTLLLDGWGIHMSIRGGWVWNLWGRDCVVIHLKQGVLRIGTDDAENLAEWLTTKINK